MKTPKKNDAADDRRAPAEMVGKPAEDRGPNSPAKSPALNRPAERPGGMCHSRINAGAAKAAAPMS